MSFQEVMDLRKSNDLKKAYSVAVSDLKKAAQQSSNSDNLLWAKRAVGWVLYDYLSNCVESGDNERLIECLTRINKINLPPDETMIFEQIAWKVGKHLFARNVIPNNSNSNNTHVQKLLKTIQAHHFPKSSESYSFLFKSFHKHLKASTNYAEFADWWGFENFMPDDFQKDELKGGRKIMSIVEQAHIAYAKCLLNQENIATEKIEDFISRLERLCEKQPSYVYPPYYQARLLLRLGNKDEVLNSLLPFVRRKKTEYWAWETLSEAFPQNDEHRLACICKALTLKSQEEYLVSLRKKFASILIGKDLFDEAQNEIEIIAKTRENNEWSEDKDIKRWKQTTWYRQAESTKNNLPFYNKHKGKAEKLLYTDQPAEVIIVEYVNEEKKILNFIGQQKNTGFFNFSSELDEVSVGDLLKVRFDKKDDAYHTIHTAEIADDESPESLVKRFEESCKIFEGKSFGFVDDIFLPRNIINDLKLEDGQEVKGKAMPSYDEKKSRWGWRVFQVDRVKE